MRPRVLAVTALLAGLPALTLAAPDPKLIESCEHCHGPNGVSTRPDVPTIAGISAAVHGDALKAYRAKTRPCPTVNNGDMCTVAAQLSDAQIADLAAFFAAKPYAAQKQSVDAAKAAQGQAIHTRDCKMCHSGVGGDPADDAGILAGQPIGWLKEMLTAARAGKIDQPAKMKAVTSKLSDADIEALAHFYASH
jgi:cytochrome subunit of sulfide dehydrogenase